MNHLHKIPEIVQETGADMSYILCGDFNTPPDYPAYQMLTEGQLNASSREKLLQLDADLTDTDLVRANAVISVLQTIPLLYELTKGM